MFLHKPTLHKGTKNISYEPSHDKIFGTHAHDYNALYGKTSIQCVSELPRNKRTETYFIKL